MISPKSYKNVLEICSKAQNVSGQLHSLTGAISMSQVFDNAIYRPEYFKVYELVDPITFNRYGDKSLAFMDSRILWTFDAVREYFNAPCIVNNYMTFKVGDTVYKFSGLRLPESLKNDSERSQHLYGRAGDVKIKGVSAEEARQEIISKWKTEPAFRFITAIEDAVDWLHIDCRNTGTDTLLIFKKG